MKISRIVIIALGTISILNNPLNAEVRFRLNPYIMPANIEGDLSTEGNPASVDIGIGDAFDKGNGAVGVDFEIRNGGWSVASQFMYTSLSDTNPEVPDLIFDGAQQNWDQTTFTFGLGYSIIGEGEDGYLDLRIGGRLASTSTELELRGGPDDRREYDSSETWVDPLVGLYSMAPLGESTFFQLGGDIGGFDAASKLTWQAVAALDLVLSPKASLNLGYRAMSLDYESDDNEYKYDIIMHGPVIGFDFVF